MGDGPSVAEKLERVQAVGGVVVGVDGRVLLVKRGRPPLAGAWSIPGGHVDAGESLEAAVAREVLEETGIAVRVVAALAVVALTIDGAPYDIHEFLCASLDAGPPEAGDDAADAVWADVGSLADFGLSERTLEVVFEGLRHAPRIRGGSSSGW
jgi:ADP-ribose pyrophosphatase YjhB (NUDIX family)